MEPGDDRKEPAASPGFRSAASSLTQPGYRPAESGDASECEAQTRSTASGLRIWPRPCTRPAAPPPPWTPRPAEALAQLREAQPPLDAFAAFLQAVAEGINPAPPAGLPEPLEQLARSLLEALPS
jgi:hypothetical protein